MAIRYLVHRLISAVFVLLGVSTVVFFILNVFADPAALMLPPNATHSDYEQLREALGLNRPLPVRYLSFLGGALTANFGNSFRYNEPALVVVLERFPATLALTATALLIACILAVPLGILAAVKRNTLTDRVASVIAFIGQAVPVFWLGTMLIIVVSVSWRLLPTSGAGTPLHLILPALTLAAHPIAQFTRITRSEMLEVLSQDYVRTARAKGLGERAVLYAHALKNAGIPLVTLIGLNLGTLLGGAIITEAIFAWPGVGRLVVQALSWRDLPVVQASVFYIAAVLVLVNLLVDLLYTWLDPRVRLG